MQHDRCHIPYTIQPIGHIPATQCHIPYKRSAKLPNSGRAQRDARWQPAGNSLRISGGPACARTVVLFILRVAVTYAMLIYKVLLVHLQRETCCNEEHCKHTSITGLGTNQREREQRRCSRARRKDAGRAAARRPMFQEAAAAPGPDGSSPRANAAVGRFARRRGAHMRERRFGLPG